MNILYLTHRVPYPPNRGDRIRSYHVLRFLAGHGRVYLGCLSEEPLAPGVLKHLEDLCAEVAVVPLGRRARWVRAALSAARGRTATEGLFASPELKRTVRTWANRDRMDAVVVFCSSMLQYADVPQLNGVRRVVDLVDVDSQKWFDYADSSGGLARWLYRLEGRRLRRLETSLVGRADAVTLVSEPEARLFRRMIPNDRTYAIGNGVDLDYFKPDRAEAQAGECVFVGALDYRANVEGLCWFCSRVWPLVKASMPGATFRMVGRRPATALRGLAEAPGVELVGEVPDVRPFLSRAEVVVVPLQIARGIQNKVLEALAMRKAVVASGAAAEGLRAEPGVHLLCADEPEDWAAAIYSLLASAARRQQLGEAGRQFVEQQHVWSVCLQPFEDLLVSKLAPDAATGGMEHPDTRSPHTVRASLSD